MTTTNCVLVTVTNYATGEILMKRAKRGDDMKVARELIQRFRDWDPSYFDEERIEVEVSWPDGD